MRDEQVYRSKAFALLRCCIFLNLLLVVWMSRQPENISAAAPKTAASMHVAASDSAGLIAAINAANDEVAHPGTDTIVLAGGTYNFNVANNPWYGPNALPAIFSSITVEGNGATLQIVGEPKRLRFFYVGADSTRNGTANFLTQGAGTLKLRNLTLKGGQQKGGDTARGGGGAGLGGAIFNHGTVTLEAVTLVDNRAIGGISFPYDTTENFDLSHENSGGGGLGEDTASNSARRSSGMGFIFIPPFASLSFLGNSGVLTGTGGGGFSPNPQGNGHVGSLSGGGNGGGAARDGLGGDGGAGGFP